MDKNKYTWKPTNRNSITPTWQYKEGVFEMPQGGFIARVRKGKNKCFTTIGKFKTWGEADTAYKQFIHK
jgi:hypothetical protein